MSVHYKIDDLAYIGPAVDWCQEMIEKGIKAGPVVITMGRETRTVDQNKKMWPMLTDISRQVEWFGQKHSPDVWKEIVTGSFRSCQFVPNIENTGFVAVGRSTSRMDKATFSALIEYLYAFGDDQGVQWSDESQVLIDEHRQAKKEGDDEQS